MTDITSLCVFCGSNTGRDPAFLAGAQRLGTLLGGEGITLVYGGASVGTMGALADATLRTLGYTNVAHLQDGLVAWNAARLPLVGRMPSPY